MGLGESETSIDKGLAIACSICLEIVAGGADRSTARLQCGHEFHLDCIGSAFNAKGAMQCPNCRKVEKGNWLYANGSRSLPELSFDEWTHDEDLYDISYTEMTLGIHWCPFSRLARVPSSFEEGEPSPAFAFQDLIGYPMFTGNTATSLTADPGSYLGYHQPLQPSASLNPHISSESPTDHWNHVSGPPEAWTSHVWEHDHAPYSLPSSRTSGSYQDAFSSPAVSAMRVDSDSLARAGFYPVFVGNGSSSRLAGSFSSSLVPPYVTTSSRPHGHVRVHHYPPGPHGAISSGTQRQGPTNGLPPVGPTPPALPDHATYYLFPPTASTSRSHQDVDSTGDHFYSWERDRFAPFPLLPVPVDRESGWWRPFPHATSSSESGSRAGFWHRNGSERSSQGRTEAAPYRPPHSTRMRPYI